MRIGCIYGELYRSYTHNFLLLKTDFFFGVSSLALRSLAYLADIHSALIIILKASLKWVPIVGPVRTAPFKPSQKEY
jgi:hypothetical protein